MRYHAGRRQGNFGSIDGDSAAAYRYTECRLQKIAGELLADIDMETVDFVPNYDGKEMEPSVLPARFPNLLVNGSSGIAVGMATNIPPHNLGEVVDACLALLKDPAIDIEELIRIMPAPDFPTGGIIYGTSEVKKGYRTGRGRVIMRARTHIEDVEKGGRQAIIIDELPYQVEQGAAADQDRRDGAREAPRGHRGPARRERQVGHARRDRAEARRGRRDRPEQPLQAHAAAGNVRHEHGRAARRPAEAAEPEAVPRRPSCATAARSSRAAPSSTCARRATAATCWKASPWRSRTWTR
jgi:hypothetical protein